MAITNREILHAFFKQYASTHVDGAMNALERYFKRAREGKHLLESASDEIRKEALTVLQSLFPQKKVQEVILVSRSLLLEYPELVDDEIYDGDYTNSLWGNLEKIKDNFKDHPWFRFWYSFNDSPEKNFKCSFRDSIRNDPSGYFLNNFWNSLSYYIGSTIAGKTEVAEKLEQLVHFQLKAIILWEKKRKPGTWIVLCD